MARVLVGIPCFRLPEQVGRCLGSLIHTPADILAVDNAADIDVKRVLQSFGGRIKIISSPNNEYCNGGWNRILKHGLDSGYDIIGLGSSDVTLGGGWYETLQSRAATFSDEVWLPRIGEPSEGVEYVYGGVAGFLTFLPRTAAAIAYPIPSGLRMWYGDEWIYNKVRSVGFRVTIINSLKAQHEWSSVTAVTPEAYAVIEQDKIEWQRLHSDAH
jgi:hypothetical protein